MKLIIILSVSVLLASCTSGWCIKVDGKYQEKQGSIEYCYDPEKGLFKNSNDTAILVTEEQLKKIKSEDSSASIKSMKYIDILLTKFNK